MPTNRQCECSRNYMGYNGADNQLGASRVDAFYERKKLG